MKIKYLSFIFTLNLFLYSSDCIYFDLDPIENNQFILNSYNTASLDTVSFSSIIFNQNHHLPYGTFIFKDINDINVPDTSEVKTQFIHKKGDYRFRDLILALSKNTKNNINYRLVAHNKSFTPLSIYNLNGKNYLQNFVFDLFTKSDNYFFSTSLAFHKENPFIPISYNFNSFNEGVFSTRESESMLWGFEYIKLFNEKYSLKYKNSSQISSLLNKFNISEVDNSEQWRSFENMNFTIWNIVNSNYRLSENINFNFDFISKSEFSSYESYLSNFNLEKLEYEDKKYLYKIGLKTPSFHIGFDLNSFNYIDNNFDYSETYLKPFFSVKILDKKNLYLKFNHRSNDISLNFPYDSIYQDSSFEIPRYIMTKSEFEFLAGDDSFKIKFNSSYISSDNIYSGANYDDYLYSSLSAIFNSNYMKFILGFNSYDKLNDKDIGVDLPFLKYYLNYNLSYEIPFKNKEYSIVLNIVGRKSMFSNKAFNLNTLPVINGNAVDASDSMYFMDFSGTLKFDNFQISYHNITNNGKRFMLQSGLSDLGESFTLPKYSILGSELFIFHYLKVSWTFID